MNIPEYDPPARTSAERYWHKRFQDRKLKVESYNSNSCNNYNYPTAAQELREGKIGQRNFSPDLSMENRIKLFATTLNEIKDLPEITTNYGD